MGIVLDIVFVVVLAASVLVGYKSGFVRSLVEFVGSIAALFISVFFANFVADHVREILERAGELQPLQIVGVKAASSLLLFIGLLLLVRLAARALGLLFRLPLLHQINGLLGAAFGVLKGAVTVLLLCAVLQVAQPYLQIDGHVLGQEDLAASHIFSFVAENNPLKDWFSIKL